MGMQITSCRTPLERLDDTISELRGIAEPQPSDADSPAEAELASLRTAAGRLADSYLAAMTSEWCQRGGAPTYAARRDLQALGVATARLGAIYNLDPAAMYDEGSLLWECGCLDREISEALQEVEAARYESPIRQALEPALDGLARAERLADDLADSGRDDLLGVADEVYAEAFAEARTAIEPWRRPHTMLALRAVLADRGRLDLLDAV